MRKSLCRLSFVLCLLALPSSLLALPSGYISLERDGQDGLPFNGSDWIATDYCPAAGDRFECDVTVADVQVNASAAVFGTVREVEPERTFAFYVRQNGDDSTVVVYGDTARGRLFPRDKEVSLSVGPDGASWVWDGGSERLSLMPGFARDGVTPLLIGDANAARREDGILPAETGAAMKLHRFRIWRGGLELVHDYVPCSNAVSGVLGVFDLCETAGKNPFRGLNMLSDIPYRVWDRERSSAVECVCSNAFLVLPDTTVLKDNCWYFVRDAVSCGEITVEGSAHLILGAGAKLTARAISGGTLAVYGQPQGVGELTMAGTVSSGLTVEGGFLSAGTVSGETFAVVGGTVTADSVDAGTVTIAGGSVRTPVETGMATNSVGQKVYCVTVAWKEGSEEGRGLRLEGLSGYGTNDIYAIDGKVYLWLPDGTHRFSLSDGQTTFRYCAVVKERDITVEPLPPILKIGFFVNGEDVGQRAGDGWTYGTNTVLTLDGQTSFVLSGAATNGEVQVTAMTNGTTVVLSNAFVFATGRPALEVKKSMSLQMAGGESWLGATNVSAAVSVATNAVLTVVLAPDADKLKSKIGVFNYGGTNAISGAGAVSVNGGTFLVQSDMRAVGAPVKFTVGEAEVMMTGSTPEKLKPVQTYNGELCVLAAPGVTITLKEIPHVTGFTVSNAVETITNVTGAATCRVLAGDDVFVGYTVAEGCFSTSPNPLVYRSVMNDVVVDAGKIEILPYLRYRTWNGERTVDCVCSNYTVVAADTATFADGRWYAVTGTVSVADLKVDGSTHIILCDGATLTANAITNGALAVYGQPSGCGELEVSGTVATALTCEGGILSAGTLSGGSLAVVGGTLAVNDVKDCKATIDGGSVKVSDNFGQTDFVNRTGRPLHCVTAKLSEEGRAGSEEGRAKRLAVEGLGGYGTNDIFAVEGAVYLWLPDGAYRFAVSDGETIYRYFAVVDGSDISVEPGVPVTPGRATGFYPTAETATNAMWAAYISPRDDVAAVLGTGALLEAYRNMFGFAVTGGGNDWFVEAVLTPTARTNLAATAAGATRQIPVAAIARLPEVSATAQQPEIVTLIVTTNVAVQGCAPGFFYSLYDGWVLTNIVADANATNLNVLCGADAKVTFPEVKKPSEKAGFFKVGVGVTDNVGKR